MFVLGNSSADLRSDPSLPNSESLPGSMVIICDSNETKGAYCNASFHSDTERSIENIENSLVQPVTKRNSFQTEDRTEPHNNVTYLNGFSMVVGAIMGSGTFISPSLVVKMTNHLGLAVIVWIVCGICSLVAALCYCEIGCTFRKAGSDYLCILETYGCVPAFLCNWIMTIIIYPGVIAIVLLTFGIYVVQPFYEGCEDESVLAAKLLAVSMICFIALINCHGNLVAKNFQLLFTAMQAMTVLFIVLLGVWKTAVEKTDNYSNMFTHIPELDMTELGQFALAMYSASWAYGGWDIIGKAAEKFSNPERDLFRVTVTALPFTILCFLAVNLSIMSVLNKQQIASSTAVATTFVKQVLGTNTAYFVPFLIGISNFGCANAAMFCFPWSTVSAARNGHLPKIISTVHKQMKTPVPAIMLTTIIAVLLYIPETSTLLTLINYSQFSLWLIRLLAIFATVVLRVKKPELKRPFKLNIIAPIMTCVIISFLIIAPFITKPMESSISIGVILAGLPFYYIFVHKKNSHPAWFVRFRYSASYSLQRLLNCVPSEHE